MSHLEPFPEDIWNEIREYPGNHKCCDCPSLDSDWGSVSHGTLICLECAGKHRSLGVHVSFVRSIRMDSWSREQIEMMRQGGNDQIRRFYKKLEIENSPIQVLYCTKGANHYRERLKERVDKIMKGEIKSERRIFPGKAQVPKLVQLVEEVKLTPTVGGDTLNIVFKDGPMGMTLTKDYRDMAVVSKLVPGGAAQCSGIQVGDTVIGVSGKAIDNYDEIMHMIPCMSRPLTIKFIRKSVAKSSAPSSVHTSRSEPSLTQSAVNHAFEHSMKMPTGDSGSKSNSSSRSNSRDNLPSAAGPTTPPSAVIRSHSKTLNGSRPRLQRANSASDGEETVVSNASLLKKSPRGYDKTRLRTASKDEGTPLERVNSGVSQPSSGSPSNHRERGHSGDASPVLDHNAPVQKLVFSSKDGKDSPAEEVSKEVGEQDEVEGEEEDDEDVEEDGEGSEEDEAARQPKKFVLEPGVIVRVLVGNKWLGAVIKRKHKDNTFKVLFRDDTSESHVPLSRMALPSSKAEAAEAEDSGEGEEDEEVEEEREPEYPDIHSQPVHLEARTSAGPAPAREEDEGEFVVGSTEVDLEEWMEEEFSPAPVAVSAAKPRGASPNTAGGVAAGKARPQGIGSKANAVDGTVDPTTGSTPVREITAIFQKPPLGLTLTANANNEPEVSKVVEGGQAHERGLQVGDVLVKIDYNAITAYEVAMHILPGCAYPLELVFRRGSVKNLLERSSEVLMKNSMDLANRIKDSLGSIPGMGKTSIMEAPYSVRLSNQFRDKQSSSEKAVVPDTSAAVSSRFLSRAPANSSEVDVEFTEPELGFRLEEYTSQETQSVVTHVTDNAAAKKLGVRVGWVLLGINHEKYISHAHSVATLKYAKRPVTIRFKR